MLIQFFNFISIDAVFLKQSCNLAASITGQSRRQMPYGHVTLPRFVENDSVDPGKVRAHEQLPVLPFDGRNAAYQSPRFIGKCIFIYFKRLQQKPEEVVTAQCQQKMRAGHFLVVVHQSLLLRRFNDGFYFVAIVFIHCNHSCLSIIICRIVF